MRNALNSKKLKLSELRLLIVDDNQVRYNKIVEILQIHDHQVNALLLDDINTFEKQLATSWDLIVFGRAYDLKLEQTFPIIQNSIQPEIPVLMLRGEDYHPDQYSQYLTKGVFDILNLEFEASTYTMLVRALSYSRLVQTAKHLNEELETMQQQAQNLVQESNKAIAILEEGMHVEANEEYVKLFGFKSSDDLIGLPVMDVLQPKNIQQFKQNFKKISQGQFDQTGLEITTSNPNATHSTLKLEYLPAEEGVQLIVDVVEGKGVALGSEKIHPLSSAMMSIMRHLKNNPANANALVVMSLKQCPDNVLNENWELKQDYFKNVTKYLQDYSDATVYKIDPLTYITLAQAESQTVLESHLMGLKSLQKPQLISVNEQTYPLQMRVGYQPIIQEQYNDQNFLALIGQAYDTVLPEVQTQATDDLFNLDDLVNTTSSIDSIEMSLEPELSIEPMTVSPSVVKSDLGLDLELDLDLAQAPHVQPLISPSTDTTNHDDLDFDLDLDLMTSNDTTITPNASNSDLELAIEFISQEETTLTLETETPSVSNKVEVLSIVEPEIVLESEIQPSVESVLETVVETAIIQPEIKNEPVVAVQPKSLVEDNLSPMLQNLQQNLQHGLVSLKFQQYYDKDDSHMFTYEVSSSFIYDNAWQNLVDMPELNEAPNLSMDLDRWMVIEASKQLHNFVMQYPNSRIVVNLNQHILTNTQLPELVGKLAKMIGGKQPNPLILQFSEKAISENVGIAQHYLTELKKQGVQISIRDFGTLLLSNTILERIPVDMIVLHRDFNKMIGDVNSAAELQDKINAFREIREVDVSLQHLDDMNSFANAWNVDARFIQSEYFQKKMDQLVMQAQ